VKPRVLVVDDKRDLARGVALVLSELSDDIEVVHTAEDALERMSQEPADLVFSDIKMPGMDGMELLTVVGERWPRTRVVLFTGHGTIESAVAAMKRGAFDYLTKPFDNEELLVIAQRAWRELRDHDELVRLRAELRTSHSFRGIYGRDRRMIPVIDTIGKVAPGGTTVLVYGESGTGKELVARAIHAESGRGGPFVAFDAGSLPESLAEAELFGSKKGAYTGADRDRKGLFVQADGGTLFIDEVSSMPASLQANLLRVIQEKEVRPLGGSIPTKVDVRIVAATNVDPQKLLSDGALRSDLYYRLAVVRINVPPLRDRVEDIPLLANLFLERLSGAEHDRRRLSPRALRLLVGHDWPGNVRELQNVIERAAVLGTGPEVGPGDIHFEDEDVASVGDPSAGLSYDAAKRDVLDRFQRRYVERLLALTGGNLSAAARHAGITRAALHRIVKRLGLSAVTPEPDEPHMP